MPTLNSIHSSLRQARELISKQNGAVAPFSWSEEEISPELDVELPVSAYPLENTAACHDVGYRFPDDSEESEFQFFEDGRQRTIQIGCIYGESEGNRVIIPVHYFIVAAVILRREKKQLRLWDSPVIRKGIFLKKSLVPDPRLLDDYESSGLEVIDTEIAGADYYDLKKVALRKAKELRLRVEEELITRWRFSEADPTKFLVVDGPLMNLRNEANVRRCVGVSKSFSSRYFDVGAHNRIMEMQEFQRSWTFRFHEPNEGDDQRLGSRERLSWYLRLRNHRFADPEFGLIRVELSKDYVEDGTVFANRFSQSLLSERLPTSYPSPHWHNHLFPICACEGYLSSVLPSISTIKACMKG